MPKEKIAVTIDAEILKELDLMVKEKDIASRSKAIEEAVAQRIECWRKRRLFEELRKLESEAEMKESESGFEAVNEAWQKY